MTSMPARHEELSLILLFGYLLQRVDRLSIKRLGNRDMRHAEGCGRTVPMLFAWRNPYDVAQPDFFFRTTLVLHPPMTARDDEGLAERMCVPRGARPGLEGDERSDKACRIAFPETESRAGPLR
jgi:hypothetical protein